MAERRSPFTFIVVIFLIPLLWAWQPGRGLCETEPTGSEIMIIELEGPINPGTAMYVIRGLERAKEQGAAVAIIRLDTPGGLASSMRSIIKAILNSPVPVVTIPIEPAK